MWKTRTRFHFVIDCVDLQYPQEFRFCHHISKSHKNFHTIITSWGNRKLIICIVDKNRCSRTLYCLLVMSSAASLLYIFKIGKNYSEKTKWYSTLCFIHHAYIYIYIYIYTKKYHYWKNYKSRFCIRAKSNIIQLTIF